VRAYMLPRPDGSHDSGSATTDRFPVGAPHY
jgi:hypothetical protein